MYRVKRNCARRAEKRKKKAEKTASSRRAGRESGFSIEVRLTKYEVRSSGLKRLPLFLDDFVEFPAAEAGDHGEAYGEAAVDGGAGGLVGGIALASRIGRRRRGLGQGYLRKGDETEEEEGEDQWLEELFHNMEDFIF